MKKFKIVAYHKDGKISEIFPEAYEMDSKLRMMEQSELYIRLEVFIWFLDKWLFMFKEETDDQSHPFADDVMMGERKNK